jgi:hypothetical protein
LRAGRQSALCQAYDATVVTATRASPFAGLRLARLPVSPMSKLHDAGFVECLPGC